VQHYLVVECVNGAIKVNQKYVLLKSMLASGFTLKTLCIW